MQPNYQQLWDTGFGDSRSDAEWNALFLHVVDSFSKFIGHEVKLGPVTCEDSNGAANRFIGAPVSISLVPAIGLSYVGSIDISVNCDDTTSIRAILLLFSNNKRLSVHPQREEMIEDWFWFELDREDLTTRNWLLHECVDESGEWEQFMSMTDFS